MGRYWLFKTEPDEYSIDDLAQEKSCVWEGIRNYQARNRLRDEVKVGDKVFIYHSSCAIPAVVGLAEVTRAAYPDPTQFKPNSPYFDAQSSPDKPRWLAVNLSYKQHLSTPILLKRIKQLDHFKNMELVSRPRLSIQAVHPEAADALLTLERERERERGGRDNYR